MQSQFDSDCPICVPQAINSKKASLVILKLTKIIQNEKKKLKKLVSLPSEQYFKQLVDYLKLELWNEKHFLNDCSHKFLKNYIAKKVGISLDQLYCLSEHIFISLSKRKFELELIQKIAKNIHERAFQASTNQNKPETVIKNTKKLKAKKSIETQIPTVNSITNQKEEQKDVCQQNELLSKFMNQAIAQNLTEFQDPFGLCMPNYGMVGNSFSPLFYIPQIQRQGSSYSQEDIQALMSSRYFMGLMGSLNH